MSNLLIGFFCGIVAGSVTVYFCWDMVWKYTLRNLKAINSYGIYSDIEAYCGDDLYQWWCEICGQEVNDEREDG